jgi:hypothetical protein
LNESASSPSFRLKLTIHTLISFAFALGTAAALCWFRQLGAEVSPILWLAVLATVAISAILLATGSGGEDVRIDRVWPEWIALMASVVLAFAWEKLPGVLNADLEAGALVYATAVVVLFVAMRKTVLGHRAKSPRAVAHAFTCVAAAAATVVVSVAILYPE